MNSVRRLVVPLGAATLVIGLAASPAGAQSWLDNLLGGKKQEAPAPAAPAPQQTAPAQRADPGPARRPAEPKAPQAAPAPPIQAAVTAPPAAIAPLSDQQVVAKANAYFNGIGSLVGDFTQIGGDGRRLTGKIYVQRPGKLRFEYDAPSNLEIVADGSSVAVRDRKLVTQDLYSISQTPLKFLLRDRIDLARDVRIAGIDHDPEGVRLMLEDRSTLGGTSKITLFFDRQVETLSQWRIIDPQGFQTMVSLANLDRNRRVDQRLFVINYERMIDNPR